MQALIDACGHEVLYMHSTQAADQLLQDIRFCTDPRGPAAEDDQGAVPLLLRRDGGVQRMPHAEGGRWWVNGTERYLVTNLPQPGQSSIATASLS